MSQNDLAKLCNVTRQTINAIENNKYDPTLSLAFSIAHALNTGIDKVFNYNAKKN
ncbi:helix-turn-helix transcriptional regulator [Bacillus velezensis]|nr:helix-turn-helix transcriptional regulator [Bacillus velezensis]MDH3091673.1 helix-turn-helix transcriptional regulator [Bacillus velezensis]WBL41146.1 helix-turn-helix transcriptional regulator [Bacillus velezensis]WGE01759.1 helix-turn-helix transcriptional regulator [Bacillus velezensis]